MSTSKMSVTEAVAAIRDAGRDSLHNWYSKPVDYRTRGITLVAKDVAEDFNSYGDLLEGSATMVFQIGDQFFRVEMTLSSYGIWWDDEYSDLAWRETRPMNKTVSYYV